VLLVQQLDALHAKRCSSGPGKGVCCVCVCVILFVFVCMMVSVCVWWCVYGGVCVSAAAPSVIYL